MISLYSPCKTLVDGNVYFDENIIPNTHAWMNLGFSDLYSSILFIGNHPSREYIESVVQNNNDQLSIFFSNLSSYISEKNIENSLALSDFLMNGKDGYSSLFTEYEFIGTVTCSLEINYSGRYDTHFEGEYVHLKTYSKYINSFSCCG